MDNWQADLLEAMVAAQDGGDIAEKVQAAARQLGFDYWAYGLRSALPVSKPHEALRSNYPLAWKLRYAEQGYLKVDPTVQHGKRSESPLVWSNELFSSAFTLREEASAHGLSIGWAKSTLNMPGVGGMLTLARSHDALCGSERATIEPRLCWLAHMAHACFSRALVPETARAPKAALTEREIEILRWTADGKTSAEIAELLAISLNTVNFHVKNAVAKLVVANKTAAVVRAAVLGLLY